MRTRGQLLSEHLSGSARTFADLPGNVAQELLRRMDPIEYNILRTGNWTVEKMRKQVIHLLDPQGKCSVLPTHNVASLMTACLSEYIRRFPRKADLVCLEQPEEAKPKAERVEAKHATKGRSKNQAKKVKKEPARLGFCVFLGDIIM